MGIHMDGSSPPALAASLWPRRPDVLVELADGLHRLVQEGEAVPWRQARRQSAGHTNPTPPLESQCIMGGPGGGGQILWKRRVLGLPFIPALNFWLADKGRAHTKNRRLQVFGDRLVAWG